MSARLLLRGGEVVDPARGFRGRADVLLDGGSVRSVEPGIPADGAQLIDVSGKLVLPGLIDQHAHCFVGSSDLGARTDSICASTGVTTFIDGGSAGAANFEGMREFVISRSRVRILAFLNISVIGLTYLKVGELNHFPYADPDAAAEMAREHPDLILGIKVRDQIEVVKDAGLEPIRLAIRAARMAGEIPVMVHVTNPPVPFDDILALLRPGDIVSHFLHGRGHGLLDEGGKVREAARAARRRGIYFDVAHGRNHVNFPVARAAIAQEFYPDTISSDPSSGGAAGVVKDLPTTLSKFLNLGMPLVEVVRAATATPARVIGREGGLGTLQPGAVADVAVFDLEQGKFAFEDADGNSLRGGLRLTPCLTIKDGQPWWKRS